MPDLRDWLENAETRYRKIFRATVSPSVRTHGLQVFAYHERHDPLRTPVICIGSNYSQGGNKSLNGCSDDLSLCLRNYLHLRAVFEQPAWRRQWVQLEWCSSRFPILPAEDEMFLVMTNLCPWISDKEWSDLENGESQSLLLSSRLADQYLHVEELINLLLTQNRDYVIIGHGVNDNIYTPLQQFLEGRDRWVWYANLTKRFKPVMSGGKPKFVL